MKKVIEILLSIFSIGILIALFAGALSFVGYILALCIAGTTATNICTFIFKTYLPYVIIFTSIISGVGLIAMYLSKMKALTIYQDKKSNGEIKDAQVSQPTETNKNAEN